MEQWQVLVQDILSRLNDVIADLKELRKDDYKQNEDIINIKRDVQDVIKKIQTLENVVYNNKKYIDDINIQKHEVRGFIKYIKILWGVIFILFGYSLKTIIKKLFF